MEECAAEGVLAGVCGTAEGEVVHAVLVDGVRCLQVKCTVWQCDVDGVVCGRVAESEYYGWVQVLELLVDGIVDKIHVC